MNAPRTTTIEQQQTYLAAVRRRVRRADAAVLSRVAGVQVAWSVALIAGASVPLVQAIGAGNTRVAANAAWITAILGFLVVIAQGADRLFARTSGVVRADDEMRRNLAREERLYLAGSGPYADAADPFHLFVERAEAELARHDGHAAAYSGALLQNGD